MSQIPRPGTPVRLLSPAKVADILQVDPKTVTRWAKQGKLSSVKTPGGHRRYSEAEVLSFANAWEGPMANGGQS